ncbi:YafY family protein [Amycolatopsis endophytica]|uniref:Putative DNA-binding transcriptional regulator YafY n=1 Tax=Amycolatopsis endophytica TaxID=860233 RepID=A0A853BAS4_9PSEU|nr:WYL domain-containing protein [Amycolatopsis endophytica]NYI91844.1 putative DNA-binding transcriptional regulator YafY [Amycolatopsis endophytica]
MISASARLLRLLSVLSTRPEWTSDELAHRLDVHERTVRRDIAKLRELGYGIESAPGPFGGYRLGAGSRMPPLSLDDEEALAVAIALRQAAWEGPASAGEPALTALIKLQQSLPRRVGDRLRALDATVEHAGQRGPARWGHADPQVLLGLANACREGARVRLSYLDRRDVETLRDVEPQRLVRSAHRWYLVAWDRDRNDWRTFRVDRARDIAVTGRAAPDRRVADAAALVDAAITSTPYEVHAEVEFPLPLEEVQAIVPATVAEHHAAGERLTISRIGGPSAPWLSAYLIRLGVPLRVIGPQEVRHAVVEHARTVLTLHDDSGRDLS